MPLEVSRNCDVTLSSASTTLDCSAELVGVLASDDNADSSDANVLASEVPAEVLVALVEDVSSSGQGYGVDPSVLGRTSAQEVAWAMFGDRPMFGVGPGEGRRVGDPLHQFGLGHLPSPSFFSSRAAILSCSARRVPATSPSVIDDARSSSRRSAW